MADLRVEIWSPPGIATFERRIAGIDGLETISGSLYRRQLGRGTMVIPADYPRLNDIIAVDPADHSNDVASLVRVYRGATLMQEWLVSETPNVVSEQPVMVAGDDVNAVMDWAIVEAWDWDGTAEWASKFPDWIYGGTNVLVDPTFSTPSCEPRISEFWTDATSGNWSVTVDGQTTGNTLAFNIGALALEAAYQALSTVEDVLVEGEGSAASPWRVTFVDPCFPTSYSVSDGTLDEPLVATLIQLGSMAPAGWTRSQTLSTGVQIVFGDYTTFEVDTPPTPAPSGTNTALHVEANTPVGFSFPGAQTTPAVQPGGLYQGSVWVYSESTADEVRVVIRPIDEEPLIASSTWPSTTVASNTWTQLTVPNIQIPDTDSRVIFRVASVQNSHAVNLWITDAELNAGLPPANAGEIIIDLLDDAQTDHAPARETLTFIKPSFTTTDDTSATAWPGDLNIDIPRGMTYRKVLESKLGPLGYEWSVRPDLATPGEWWLDVWAPGTRVTDVTADETPSLLVGQGTLAGYATKSVPKANRVMAEGAGQYTSRAENTASQPVIGVREAYVADISYVSTSVDDYAQQTLDRFLDFSLAPRFDIADLDTHPIPILDYGLATRLNVDLADGGGKISRDVEAFTYQQTDALVWTVHTGVAQFDQPVFRRALVGGDENVPFTGVVPTDSPFPVRGAPVAGYAPTQNPVGVLGPVVEGTRWLLDEFQRLRPFVQPSSAAPVGGGGELSVTVAAVNASDLEKSKADFLCNGASDAATIMAAFGTLADAGRIVLSSGEFRIDPDIIDFDLMNRDDVVLSGMGMFATTLRVYGTTGAAVRIAGSSDAVVQDLGFVSMEGGVLDPLAAIHLDQSGINRVRNVSFFGFNTDVLADSNQVTVFGCRSIGGRYLIRVPNPWRDIQIVDCYADEFLDLGDAVSVIIAGNILGGGIIGTDPRGWIIANNEWQAAAVFNNGLIELGGATTGDASEPGCVVVGNTVGADIGWAFVYADGVADLVVTGNQSFGGNVALVDCPRPKISGNIIRNVYEDGVDIISCDDATVQDNTIEFSGDTTTNTYDLIQITTTDRALIAGNKLVPVGSGGADQPRYGINIVSGTANRVVGNDLGVASSYGSGPLNDGGTSTAKTYPADPTYGDNFTS